MEEAGKKLLIAVDGNSLMHRAFYALPDMRAKDGTPTGALYGFMTMLLSLVKKNPDYFLVAFDMHGPTFRHEKYDEYKAGRRETPDDLRKQFPILNELLSKLGIRTCECEHFEADDILGTIAKRSEKEGIDTLIVSGDRDGFQLVSDHIHVLLTKKGISETLEYTPELLMETYGLEPDRMRDLKGLMGDSSDHIPGIPGVGEKTALSLLESYKTLEGVLENGENIKGKLGEKVRENGESARLSYWLGTIVTDAPISVTANDCVFHPEEMKNATPFLASLGMNSIVSKLGEGAVVLSKEEKVEIEIKYLETEQELKDAIASVDKQIAITFEPEFSFAGSENCSYLIKAGDTLFDQGIPVSRVLNTLKGKLEDSSVRKVLYDYKRTLHELSHEKIEICGEVEDVMIEDYLLNSLKPSGSFLEMCQASGRFEKPTAAALFYLDEEQRKAIEDSDMMDLYREIEIPLAKVLYEMEQEGSFVDENVLNDLNVQFEERISELKEQIYELAGEEFNILSPKQLGTILFEKLQLPTGKKNKSGYSTDAETLERLKTQSPVVALILEYRFLSKLKSTYIDGLLQARSQDGRVRSKFNQCLTATGRISSSEPNLQNIPVRTDLGREIRRAFVASPGHVLVDADYSQIELRILAHLSQDEQMIQAFLDDEDIHRRTASEVFNIPFEEVTSQQRSAAKAVNFGIVYGISEFGLSNNLEIPISTARNYINMYFDRYPKIKQFMDDCIRMGKENGFAETIFHRRRPLPELSSSNYNIRSFGERVAMNMPIQGSSADIIKMAMIRVSDALRDGNYQSKLVLQVHDELLLDVVAEEQDQVFDLVKNCMEKVVTLSVPLIADAKKGNSWFETK